MNQAAKKEGAEPDLQGLKQRLEEWADWYSRGQLYRLGYPSQSLEYRALTQGRSLRRQGAPDLPSHASAEEMEAWVSEMAQYHLGMARALRAHYFHRGSLRGQARELKVSHMSVKRLVDKAHGWLLRRWKGLNLTS